MPPSPPAGFNPLTASDAELDYYGFPPRPDAATAPGDYAFWAHIVTLPSKRVTPTFQQTNVYNGPAQNLVTAGRSVNGATGSHSNNW